MCNILSNLMLKSIVGKNLRIIYRSGPNSLNDIRTHKLKLVGKTFAFH